MQKFLEFSFNDPVMSEISDPDSTDGFSSDDSQDCGLNEFGIESSFDSYDAFQQALQEYQRKTFTVSFVRTEK